MSSCGLFDVRMWKLVLTPDQQRCFINTTVSVTLRSTINTVSRRRAVIPRAAQISLNRLDNGPLIGDRLPASTCGPSKLGHVSLLLQIVVVEH